ncbi:MAG: chemotaxis protein CheW [Gemmatimonadaceae bacterium]
MDILTFELDGRRHAFRADDVVQVVQMVEVSPLPGAPAVIEGIVNVRGAVVPVFDLRARLGVAARGIDPSQHLVILASGARSSAVRVDVAEDFVSIPDADIAVSLADSGLSQASSRHIAGVAATADGTTIIYDLAAFLSQSETETLDNALATARG